MRYRWLIENRISIRQFQDIPVDKSKLLDLIKYSGEINGLVKDIKTQFFFIVDGDKKRNVLEGKVGYEGHLINAPHYIGIISEAAPHYLQNSSYMMEELLLKATELNLGTCWLTVEPQVQEILKKDLDIKIEGQLIAFAAIGYPKIKVPYAPQRTSTRIPLNEFVYCEKWGEKPMTKDMEIRGLANILYHTRMAPSWKNQQPWKLILDGSQIILVVGGEFIPEKSLLVDSGIMMLYLERIFNEAGIRVKWILYENDREKNYKQYCIPEKYRIIGYLQL